MICEMLPEPIRKYRKVVHELIAEADSKNFGHYEDQIKLGGFPGAAMGFTVGLTRDLPRGIINDTLKLVLDPLGSICEFLDGVDPYNPDNYVHQIEKAWQEGDSFSRGRIVGNTVGQVALAFTPAIIKKFAKIPTGLGEARAVEVKPRAAGIAEEAGAVAREKEVASSGAKTASAEARADFYVKPNGELVPSTGYRYMDSRYTKQTLESMEAPGSYFGVEKFDSAATVRDAYQVSSEWSNCRLRGQFDTLQVIDDIRIPKTFGNEGTSLEPITRCYPEYGEGGHQQFICKDRLKFDQVDIIGD